MLSPPYWQDVTVCVLYPCFPECLPWLCRCALDAGFLAVSCTSLRIIDMLTCVIGLALLLLAWRIVQISFQQEMQYDITQQLQAQEAAVPGFPLSPHCCCQGWQQVRQHCFVMHHNLVTVLTQGFQALEQHCLQGQGILCFATFLCFLFSSGLRQELLPLSGI